MPKARWTGKDSYHPSDRPTELGALGLFIRWGKAKKVIKVGDVVWIPPNTKHWHGATQKTSMTHTAIQEQRKGKVVTWMELVSDLQYTGVKKKK